MNNNVKSAIFGGLAATFVVTAALAPKFMSTDRPQSTVRFEQTSEELPIETTTTTMPEETTTTTEPEVTTTTQAPTTTTTTTTPPAPPTVSFMKEEGGVITLWAINKSAYTNPAVRFTLTTGEEIVLPITTTDGPFTYVVNGATSPVFGSVIQTEWDGGFLPTGKGYHSSVVLR